MTLKALISSYRAVDVTVAAAVGIDFNIFFFFKI